MDCVVRVSAKTASYAQLFGLVTRQQRTHDFHCTQMADALTNVMLLRQMTGHQIEVPAVMIKYSTKSSSCSNKRPHLEAIKSEGGRAVVYTSHA